MSLAKELRELVASHQDANLEFARAGYRLSLNPVEDRFDELGFILWEEHDGALMPIAAGRAVGDDLLLDGPDQPAAVLADLEATIRALLANRGGETADRQGGQ